MPTATRRTEQKERTRLALSAAAMEILAVDGIEAVTADAVAERAGVSRRTFFNYFPRVEEVLTAGIEAVTRDTVDAFVARPADEPLRDSVRVVLDEVSGSPAFAQALELERAAVSSPATRRFLREFQDSQVQALETGLWRRLGPTADPAYVASLAAATAGVMARLTRLSVEQDPAPSVEALERHQQLLRTAVERLFGGFEESAAYPYPTHTQER